MQVCGLSEGRMMVGKLQFCPGLGMCIISTSTPRVPQAMHKHIYISKQEESHLAPWLLRAPSANR